MQYDDHNRACGSDVLYSAGKDSVLCIRPEKTEFNAGGHDLVYLPIELIDEKGVRRNLSDTEVTITVQGPAELIGLGSASLSQDSLKPYTGNRIHTYEGRALAILRSGDTAGDVKVTVSAKGMPSTSIAIKTR